MSEMTLLRGVLSLARKAPQHLSPTAQTVQTKRRSNRVATRKNEMDKNKDIFECQDSPELNTSMRGDKQ